MQTNKFRLIGGGLLVVLAPILFLFFTFKNSVDCSQLVIDTYEIHSGINIPKVNSVNCQYDAEQQLRISVYDLEGSMMITEEMSRIKLEPASSVLTGAPLLEDSERPGPGQYFLAQGTKWGRSWTYLFNERQDRLWVQIEY